MENSKNPTTRTHEKILEYLRTEKNLVSTNHISKKLNLGWYAVNASVDFLAKLDVLEVFPSNNEGYFFRLKNREVKNGN